MFPLLPVAEKALDDKLEQLISKVIVLRCWGSCAFFASKNMNTNIVLISSPNLTRVPPLIRVDNSAGSPVRSFGSGLIPGLRNT